MFLLKRNLARFSLDFSNLSKAITSEGSRNYKIQCETHIKGYMSKNGDQKNLHTVIMIHQWWGFNQSMTQTAEIFSSKDIRVFVPDLYRGKAAIDHEDANHKMSNLDWAGALKDIQSIKEHLEPTSKSLNITGFCMGGALTFASLASIPGWKSGIPFYGIPDLTVFKLENITAKVIANFGSEDPLKGFSDPESAAKLAAKAKECKAQVEVKIWEGVSHAFCNQDSRYFNAQTRDKSFALARNLITS